MCFISTRILTNQAAQPRGSTVDLSKGDIVSIVAGCSVVTSCTCCLFDSNA